VILTKILSIKLHPTTLKMDTLSSFENLQWAPNGNTILWLDVSEYEKIDDLQALAKNFRLHPLALDDCVHVRQRPKIDDFHENLFLICRTVSQREKHYTEGQQIGIFKGKDYLITVHKEHIPQLDGVLEEITRKPELAECSSSFILYRILDAVVDDFEDAVRNVEEMECVVGNDVLKNPPPANVLDLIYTNRSNLLLISRFLRSQSHVVHCLAKGDFQLVNSKAAPFFRDVYDHTLRTLERIDSLIDMNMGSLNIYSISVGNRMNEVMKLLTVISTIGMPLTILVGWYGMNFHIMPEIDWTYGYVTIIVVAIVLITVTVLLFKRKGWL
jgi:magnesium transporter